MMDKDNVRILPISPDILESTIQTKKRIDSQLPDSYWLPDPHGYMADINTHIQNFFNVTRGLGEVHSWEVLTPAAFKMYADKLVEPLRLELWWRDATIQTNTYSILVAFKAESILHSLVRAVNARDLVSPAMLARGLLEHAATAYTNFQLMLSVFERVSTQSKPVIIAPDQFSNLEEALVRAIWGTRIGRGVDRKKRPIWETSPYKGNSIDATNILTDIQKLSSSVSGLNHSVLKVYEWLSDVVHPSTQGYRIFWDEPMLVAEGHTRFSLRRSGGSDAGYVQGVALWAAGYSTVVLTHLLVRVNKAVGEMYKHLDTVYKQYVNAKK